MDYIRVYNTFISYCKNSSPKQRMLDRNPFDFRLTGDVKLYTEIHHITPLSLGGCDNSYNLVELLPEEHLFAHKLRYKAYNNKEDFLSVRVIINGLNSHSRYGDIPHYIANKINSSYAWIKQNSYDFRCKHGWQSENGKRRISESRANTFPVRCVNSGEIIGSFDKNHPKIISGEWVHHSKGKHKYYNTITGESVFCFVDDKILDTPGWVGTLKNTFGENNNNYSGITDSEIYEFYRKLCVLLKINYGVSVAPSLQFMKHIWHLKYNTKIPNFCGGLRSGFRFGGDLYGNLIYPITKELGIEYIKYSKTANNLHMYVQEIVDAIG